MTSVFTALLRIFSTDSIKEPPPLRVSSEEEPIILPSWMHPREIFASNGSRSPLPSRSAKRKVALAKQEDFLPPTIPASNRPENLNSLDTIFSTNGVMPHGTATSDSLGMAPDVILEEAPAHYLSPKFTSTNFLPSTNGAPRRSSLLRQASAMVQISAPPPADVQADRWKYLWETQQKVGQVKGIAEDACGDLPSFPRSRRGIGAGANERKLGFRDRSQTAAPDFASFLTKT